MDDKGERVRTETRELIFEAFRFFKIGEGHVLPEGSLRSRTEGWDPPEIQALPSVLDEMIEEGLIERVAARMPGYRLLPAGCLLVYPR